MKTFFIAMLLSALTISVMFTVHSIGGSEGKIQSYHGQVLTDSAGNQFILKKLPKSRGYKIFQKYIVISGKDTTTVFE